MRLAAFLLAATCGLSACGGDADTDSMEFDDLSESELAEEMSTDDPELGALRVALAGETQDTRGYCQLTMTRLPDDQAAVIAANLSVGPFVDGTEWDSGELTISRGTDPEFGETMQGFSYEPPTRMDSDGDDSGWTLDIENPEPSAFSLMVDGEPYDFSTGDLRGTDDASKAPHLWPVQLTTAANLVNPRDDGQSTHSRGEFAYDGLCTVSIRVLQQD
jgi:hypothetical protein